jgi:hypothetical protein
MSHILAVPRPQLGSRRTPFWLIRWLPSAAVYALLLTLGTLAAYWAMFSQFAPYDDEGFFLYSLKLFVGGHPLYSSVFSDYGPFYYELFGGLFKLSGHAVSTDTGRLLQLAIWLASTLGLAAAAQRLTGRVAIGAAAFATSFGLMTVLTNEPMHPEALTCALLTAMALVITFGLEPHGRASLVAIGALAAALLTTKVNVGGYAMIAVAFAAVTAGPGLSRYTILRWPVTAAFVLVGPVVMVGKLNTAQARSYALLAVLSALSVVFVTGVDEARVRAAGDSLSWPRWLLAGFLACLILVLGIVFALGSSPLDLIDQTISVPARQGSILSIPVTLGDNAIWWSLGATAIAWTLRRSRLLMSSAAHERPSITAGLLRLLVGVAILLSLVGQFPFAISPDAPFALAMPLAWVAALPSRRDSMPRVRLARLLIPSLAVLQALVAYPVAGSQLGVGSILFVLCAAICLSDGAAEIVFWGQARGSDALLVVNAGLTALLVAVAIGTAYQAVVQPVQTYHDIYRANTTLPIVGANRLHLPQPVSAAFAQVVAQLRAQCRTLISLPGLYSFNLWSGLPAPSPLTGEQPYWTLLSSDQQRTVLTAAKSSPTPCLLRSSTELAFYTAGAALPRVPLVAYLEDRFVPFAQVGPYILERPRR